MTAGNGELARRTTPPSLLEKMAARLAAAKTVAGVTWHAGMELIRPEALRDRTQVPRSAEALTSEWLTDVLCHDQPGCAVTDMELLDGHDGTTSRRALRVQYNAAGQQAGLPERLFVKAVQTLGSRVILGPTGAARTEGFFYTSIRPGLPIETPNCYYAGSDQRSCRFLLLLDDVSITRGARFASVLELDVDRVMAESMVRQMATYHAAFWESPRFTGDLRSVETALQFQTNLNRLISFERACQVGIERSKTVLPTELLARQKTLFGSLMRSLVHNAQGPETLLHSDVHPGNWYVTSDRRMGQHDWQGVTRGLWALDVSYALACALRIEDRRAWERDLLGFYLECLAKGRVDNRPTLDEALLAYRQQVFHGLFYWLPTIGRRPYWPVFWPDDVSLACIERLATAVVDHDSVAAVGWE